MMDSLCDLIPISVLNAFSMLLAGSSVKEEQSFGRKPCWLKNQSMVA
jgi:hypothetical protein